MKKRWLQGPSPPGRHQRGAPWDPVGTIQAQAPDPVSAVPRFRLFRLILTLLLLVIWSLKNVCDSYVVEGYSDSLWIGTFHWEFKRRPIPIFLKKVTHSYTTPPPPDFGSNFQPNLTNFSKIFTFFFGANYNIICKIFANLAQIFENFEKWTHSYTKICKEKWMTDKPVRLIFCYPWLQHSLYPLLYLVPSGSYMKYRIVSNKRSPSNKRPPNLFSNKTR